jgi:hypothetical protein
MSQMSKGPVEPPRTAYQPSRGSNKKIKGNADFNSTGQNFLGKRGSANRNPKIAHNATGSMPGNNTQNFQGGQDHFLPKVGGKDTI